jgi:hypothetical protein
MKLDRKAFADAAKADFEFTRETRYLTGTIKLDFGTDSWALNFANGKLADVTDGAAAAEKECKIVVGGTPEQWDMLLEMKPEPFYQCIQSAAVKHGMRITDTNETFAYLPGLNRMTTLLRELKLITGGSQP